MTALSDYAENKLVAHILGLAAFTMPTNIYLALFTSDPFDDASGNEVAGGSYARQLVNFNAVANGQTANSNEISFPVATADWGTITHWAIFDAPTGGNMLIHNPVDLAFIVNNGTTVPPFAAGSLKINGD